MPEKTFRFTVDVEKDWGGRSQAEVGIEYGIPKILDAFRAYKVKGLFFISTETLKTSKRMVRTIVEYGHDIGSHGHFHMKFKEPWRAEQDLEISKSLLEIYRHSRQKGPLPYRAPKFYYLVQGERYSDPAGHVSLLKYMWLKTPIKDDSIIYLHPFDIVETAEPAPDLFCMAWYSKPDTAYDTFISMLKKYS